MGTSLFDKLYPKGEDDESANAPLSMEARVARAQALQKQGITPSPRPDAPKMVANTTTGEGFFDRLKETATHNLVRTLSWATDRPAPASQAEAKGFGQHAADFAAGMVDPVNIAAFGGAGAAAHAAGLSEFAGEQAAKLGGEGLFGFLKRKAASSAIEGAGIGALGNPLSDVLHAKEDRQPYDISTAPGSALQGAAAGAVLDPAIRGITSGFGHVGGAISDAARTQYIYPQGVFGDYRHGFSTLETHDPWAQQGQGFIDANVGFPMDPKQMAKIGQLTFRGITKPDKTIKFDTKGDAVDLKVNIDPDELAQHVLREMDKDPARWGHLSPEERLHQAELQATRPKTNAMEAMMDVQDRLSAGEITHDQAQQEIAEIRANPNTDRLPHAVTVDLQVSGIPGDETLHVGYLRHSPDYPKVKLAGRESHPQPIPSEGATWLVLRAAEKLLHENPHIKWLDTYPINKSVMKQLAKYGGRWEGQNMVVDANRIRNRQKEQITPQMMATLADGGRNYGVPNPHPTEDPFGRVARADAHRLQQQQQIRQAASGLIDTRRATRQAQYHATISAPVDAGDAARINALSHEERARLRSVANRARTDMGLPPRRPGETPRWQVALEGERLEAAQRATPQRAEIDRIRNLGAERLATLRDVLALDRARQGLPPRGRNEGYGTADYQRAEELEAQQIASQAPPPAPVAPPPHEPFSAADRAGFLEDVNREHSWLRRITPEHEAMLQRAFTEMLDRHPNSLLDPTDMADSDRVAAQRYLEAMQQSDERADAIAQAYSESRAQPDNTDAVMTEFREQQRQLLQAEHARQDAAAQEQYARDLQARMAEHQESLRILRELGERARGEPPGGTPNDATGQAWYEQVVRDLNEGRPVEGISPDGHSSEQVPYPEDGPPEGWDPSDREPVDFNPDEANDEYGEFADPNEPSNPIPRDEDGNLAYMGVPLDAAAKAAKKVGKGVKGRLEQEAAAEKQKRTEIGGKEPVLNVDKLPVEMDARHRIAEAAEKYRQTQEGAAVRRTDVTAEAERLSHELRLHYESLDHAAAMKLGGVELRARTDAIIGLDHDIAELSKQMEEPGADQRALGAKLDQLNQTQDAIIKDLVVGAGERGRDLRALAYAPDSIAAWLKKAQTAAGDKPIPEDVKQQIREAFGRRKGAKDPQDKGMAERDLVRIISGLKERPAWQHAVDLWKTLITLPGPIDAANAIGNTTMQLAEEASQGVAAFYDTMAQLIADKPRSVAAPGARGTEEGAVGGVQDAKQIMKTGISEHAAGKFGKPIGENFKLAEKLMAESQAAVKTDKFLQTYMHFHWRRFGAADALFREMRFARSLVGEFRVIAMNEGAKNVEARVSELLKDPAKEPSAVARAMDDALYSTFNDENRMADAIHAGTSKLGPVGAIASNATIPFVRTVANVASAMVDYTPVVGLLGEMAKSNSWAPPQRKFMMSLGRQTTGGVLIATAYALAKKGELTGGGPDDTAGKQTWEAQGKGPYRVRVGDRWIDYRRMLGPLAMPLAVGADWAAMEQDAKTGPGHTLADKGAKFGNSALSLLADQTPGGQLTQFSSHQSSGPTAWLGDYLQNAALNVVPSTVANAAAGLDSVDRATDTFTDRLKNRVPGLRQTLPVKTDATGRVIPRADGLLASLVDPTSPKVANDEPALKELQRLGMNYGKPSTSGTYTGIEQTERLQAGLTQNRLPERYERTPEDVRAIADLAGPETMEKIRQVMAQPSYQGVPDEIKRAMLTAVVSALRGKATIQHDIRSPQTVTQP